MLKNGTCTAAAVYRHLHLNASEVSIDVNSAQEENGALIFIGVAMGIFGSVGQNIAQNGMDSAATRPTNPNLGFFGRLREQKANWWWFALLFTVAAITNFAAFGFAPTIILAPLEGTQFLANFAWNSYYPHYRLFQLDKDDKPVLVKAKFPLSIFFLRVYEKTPHYGRVLRGTVTVIVGILGPVIATPTTTVQLDEAALWCFWRQIPWIVYLSVTAFMCVTFGLIYRSYTADKPKTRAKSTDQLEQLLYAIPAATIGGFAVANAKIISLVIQFWLTDKVYDFWGMLTKGMTWITTVFVAVSFVLWLKLLNKGPDIYDKLTIIPLLQGCYIVFSSTSGGIFFEDFESFEAWRHVVYWSGIIVILIGLFQLVPPEDASSKEEDVEKMRLTSTTNSSSSFKLSTATASVPPLIKIPIRM